MEVNWTILAYIIIGLFALSGFFKGWWKEAITSYFLIILALLLYFPVVAQLLIASLNMVFALIARILPDSLRVSLANLIEAGLGIPTVNGAIQLDASNGGVWLIILLICIGMAILLSRALIPNTFRLGIKQIYRPTLAASMLGALIGAFNGFLIISLILAYVGGQGSSGAAPTMAGTNQARVGILQGVAVPSFSLTESWVPWLFILIGVMFFSAAIGNRISIKRDKDGYVKINTLKPLGYEKIDLTAK
jgi:hypothetical protein